MALCGFCGSRNPRFCTSCRPFHAPNAGGRSAPPGPGSSLPRSRLYAEALQQYVDEESESEVTRQLDEVAAEIDTSLDPVVKELQRRALTRPGG